MLTRSTCSTSTRRLPNRVSPTTSFTIPSRRRMRISTIIRVDHSFRSTDFVFASVDWNRTDYEIPGGLPGIAVGQNGALSPRYPAYAVAVGYTHTFSPSLVNDIHVGRNHINQNSLSSFGNTTGHPCYVWNPGNCTGREQRRTATHRPERPDGSLAFAVTTPLCLTSVALKWWRI